MFATVITIQPQHHTVPHCYAHDSFEDDVAAHGLVGLSVQEACSIASGGGDAEPALASLWPLVQKLNLNVVVEHGTVLPSTVPGTEAASTRGAHEAVAQLGADGSALGALPRGSSRRMLDEESRSALMLNVDFDKLSTDVQRLLSEHTPAHVCAATTAAAAATTLAQLPLAKSRLRADLVEWAKTAHHMRKPLPTPVSAPDGATSIAANDEASQPLDRLRIVASQRARDAVLVGAAGSVLPLHRAILDIVARAKGDGMLEADIEATFGRRPGSLRRDLESLVSRRYLSHNPYGCSLQ